MALETLKNARTTPSGLMIAHRRYDSAPKGAAHINVDHHNGRLSFVVQNGPVKEVGVNGCQLTDVIEVAKMMLEELNKKFPCSENDSTLAYLDAALTCQGLRTMDRELRGVEGFSKA